VLRRLARRRTVIAALLVVVSFRYSIGVFEPLWATHLDGLGASTLVVTSTLTMFALPMVMVAKRAGRLSDRIGPRLASLVSAAATVPIMVAYGYVTALPVVFVMILPHGLLEAIPSPGTQAAIAEAAPSEDSAAAQGLGEAAGSAAAAIGAFTAAPLYASFGPGAAWGIAGAAMAALLLVSAWIDPPRRRAQTVPTAVAALAPSDRPGPISADDRRAGTRAAGPDPDHVPT
jgi:MFS family permease